MSASKKQNKDSSPYKQTYYPGREKLRPCKWWDYKTDSTVYGFYHGRSENQKGELTAIVEKENGNMETVIISHQRFSFITFQEMGENMTNEDIPF